MKKEKKIEVGNEIDSRCLKCKDITNHYVFSMVDGKVAKVECIVCGGRHNYRPDKPVNEAAIKRKATRAASVAKVKLAEAEALFDEMLAGRGKPQSIPYGMTDIFKKGDLLNHPIFGLGIVTETVMPNKIEVMFRQQNKLLVCGRLCN